MVRLESVTKRYGDLLAVDRFNLGFEAGRTTVLIGPSGCGKSTVLRMLVGLQSPDEGRIDHEGGALDRHRLGYVIQDGGLFPHLTARGNIELLARHLGWSDAKLQRRTGELGRLTHFPSEAMRRFPGELSGGQRQRVALMRALMLDPETLLLDEPLGALDPMIRFELQHELKQIFTRLGKTVVMVTHDLAEAAFVGDTIVLMRDGRIVQQGSLHDMLANPADEFVRRFIRAQHPQLGGA